MLTALGTKFVPPWPTFTFVVAALQTNGNRRRKKKDDRRAIRTRCDGISRRRLAVRPQRH
jgi:hypothetical protein